MGKLYWFIFFACFASFLCATHSRCITEEPLPENLNSYPKFDLTDEIHLQGTFKMNYSLSSFINFSTRRVSYFRFYLAAKDDIDLDLYLKEEGKEVAHSMFARKEDMIAYKLNSGKQYQVEIRPFGSPSGFTDCQSLTIEVEIVPESVLRDRINSYEKCHDRDFFPSLDFYPIELDLDIDFDTASTHYPWDYGVYSEPSNNRYDVRFAHSYNFTLNHIPGKSSLWELDAAIGYRFITGGNIRLLLTPRDTDPHCFYNSDCDYGVNLIPNENDLHTTLSPGNYTLWVIEYVGLKFDDLPTKCSPISLRLRLHHLNKDVNSISCRAERLPSSLNAPGYIDKFGYLYYRENVYLDLSKNSQKIEFDLSTPSLLRVFTEAHRVDIDFRLTDVDGNTIASTYRSRDYDETIAIELQAGSYNLELLYYGTYNAMFCETFLLELAIQPTSSVKHYCMNKKETLPDLSGFKDTMYHTISDSFFHFYDGSEKFISTNISASYTSHLNFQLDSHFLFGDLKVWFKNMENGAIIRPKRNRYGQSLTFTLIPGVNYELNIGEPDLQTPKPELNYFPPCSYYHLSMTLSPGSADNCAYNTLPSTLNLPQYLETTNRVHIQDNYLIPYSFSQESRSTMVIQVNERSYFHAYTEPFHLDIDFELYENGNLIPSSQKIEGEEKVSHILQPGSEYRFVVKFFLNEDDYHSCDKWNLELEVAPLPNPIPTTQCENQLPSDDLLANIFNQYEHLESYAYMQESKPLTKKIPFELYSFYYLRAVIRYNFIWSDLLIRVLDEHNQTVVWGVNGFDKNEILPVALAPGKYQLEISETLSPRDSHMYTCVSFELQIAFNRTRDEDNSGLEFYKCQDALYLTPTFNNIPFLSSLSDYSTHFVQKVKVDTINRKEDILFSVTETSYFRIFVPPHSDIDIDIILYHANNDSIITSSRTFNEETIFEKLYPGDYKYSVKYYAVAYDDFPDANECVKYQTEFALLPVNEVSKIEKKIDCSVTRNLPNTIDLGKTPIEGKSIRNFGTRYTESIAFTVSNPGLFRARFEYLFIAGGVYVSLEGTNIKSPYMSYAFNKTIPFYLGHDTSYIDTVLYPGSYVLHVKDSANYGGETQLRCAELSYFIQWSEDNIPEDYCDDIDVLPTDLFSPQGGSYQYGGPQTSDGTIRVSGTHFLIPEESTHHGMKFLIKKPSWVRVWARAPFGDDIDFVLYKNSSKREYIFASMGVGEVESHIELLQPQEEEYYLDIHVFDRSERSCSYMGFVIEIKPDFLVQSELACPYPLPNPYLPPSKIDLEYGSTKTVFGNYLFPKTYIDNNAIDYYFYKQLEYETHFEAHSNYSIYVILSYDFLVSDFKLRLYDNDDNLINTDISNPVPDATGKNSFLSIIQTSIPEGSYKMKIIEKIYSAHGDKTDQCDKFTLFIIAASDDVEYKPHISRVTPPFSENIYASQQLSIKVDFSETFKTVSEEFLIQNNIAVLRLGDEVIQPKSASIDSSNRYIIFTFDSNSLQYGFTYTLNLNVERLNTENDVPFERYHTKHYYSTLSCECNGRGYCPADAPHQKYCICYDKFAGEQCETCAEGYYILGDDCIEKTYCTENSCNGHGTCSDEAGYPVCTCFEGYESTKTKQCGRCQPGYSGYPDCKIDDESRDRTCNAPLLPTDLDTFNFLRFDGTIHIQGEYYIDSKHFLHKTNFTVKKESSIRLYIEPHLVDIDFSFYAVENEKFRFIDSGISSGNEESMFITIQPGKYQIQFRFYPTARVSSCDTFNLELAISPNTQIKKETDVWKNDCKDRLPNLEKTLPDTSFTFGDIKEVFYVSADKENLDFYTYNFTVSIKAGKALVFDALVDYRFLPGDIAMRIETNGRPVAYGENAYNQQRLLAELKGGEYSLILYLPEQQNNTLTTCVPFSLEISGRYDDLTEDIFNCNYPIIPTTLNSAPYLGNGHNYLHISDTFSAIDESTQIDFIPKVSSSFRISGKFDYLYRLVLSQINEDQSLTVISEGYDDRVEIFAHVEAGKHYRLSFIFYLLSYAGFCPTVDLEIAMSPESEMSRIQENFNCSSNPTSLPVIDQNGKLYSEKPIYYYHGDERIISEYNIHIPNNKLLNVEVSSPFLWSSLHLELDLPNGNTLDSELDYNLAYFSELELSPGDYKLRIIRDIQETGYQHCIPFGFDLSLKSISGLDECYIDLVSIPKSLDIPKYLGVDGRTFIQESNWRVPPTDNIPINSATTDFTLKTDSLVRVYIENHEIDIDLYIKVKQTGEIVAQTLNEFGEESVVTKLAPGEYYFHWSFISTQTNSISDCQPFNMYLAIEPIYALPEDNECGSVQEKWPTIPSIITLPYDQKTDYSDDYFYSQSASTEVGKKLKTYSFHVNKLFDIHIEIGYKFITSDLMLALKSRLTGNTIYGTNEEIRNVINKHEMQPGSYELTIYEPAPTHMDHTYCSHFTFEMHIQPASEYNRKVDSVIELNHLDTVGFLKYSDRMHFQGSYKLFNSFFSPPKVLNFATTKPSILRASINSRFVDITIDNNQHGHYILTALNPGNHELIFSRSDESFYAPRAENLEIVVEPVEYLQSASQSTLEEECIPQGLPDIQIPPNGFYQYSGDLVATKQQLSELTLFTKTIKLDHESFISVQIGHQFSLYDIYISLSGEIGEVFSEDRYNGDDLTTIVPSGEYTLKIGQYVQWLQDQPINFCARYNIKLFISKSSEKHVHDCTNYGIFPWNLNSETGGSKEFGGPVKDGELHLFNDGFILDPASDSMIAQITIDRPSIMTLVGKHNENFGKFNIQLLDKDTHDIITPFFTDNSDAFARALTYKFEDASPHTYLIKISYDNDKLYEVCNSFIFGATLLPMEKAKKEIQCGSERNYQLPTPKLSLSNGEFGESISSYMTTENITKYTSDNTFIYTVEFTIDKLSNLDASIAFNPITNYFTLSLYRSVNNQWEQILIGYWNLQTYNSGGEVQLINSLSYTLSQGKYKLHIMQQGQHELFSGNNCYRYDYALQISGTGSNTIRYVEPPSAKFLDPRKNLYLEVRFSYQVYDKDGNAITREDYNDAIKNSICLQSDLETICPISIRAPNDVPNSDDYTRWLLGYDYLKPSTEYKLILKRDYLFDKKSNPLRLFEIHRYSTIALECNGHGTRKEGSNECECERGYLEPDCVQCADGYVLNSHNECAPEDPCVFKDACGCLPGTSGDNCEPRGECTKVAKAEFTCSCIANYTGDQCDQCASGYERYPYCYKPITCDVTCIHGECNQQTGTCDCEEGYAGSACDMKEEEPPSAGGIIAVIIITIIVVGISAFIVFKYVLKRFTGSSEEQAIPLTGFDMNEEDRVDLLGSDDLDIDLTSESKGEEGNNYEDEEEDDEEEGETNDIL